MNPVRKTALSGMRITASFNLFAADPQLSKNNSILAQQSGRNPEQVLKTGELK